MVVRRQCIAVSLPATNAQKTWLWVHKPNLDLTTSFFLFFLFFVDPLFMGVCLKWCMCNCKYRNTIHAILSNLLEQQKRQTFVKVSSGIILKQNNQYQNAKVKSNSRFCTENIFFFSKSTGFLFCLWKLFLCFVYDKTKKTEVIMQEFKAKKKLFLQCEYDQFYSVPCLVHTLSEVVHIWAKPGVISRH